MNDKLKYNPTIHHRRSIRLKGYDYSQAGLYFITICCQDREHLFGEIGSILGANDNLGEHIGSPVRMKLNDAGKMVEKWYFELENKFTDIKCHEMITMPNHFHCVIENVGSVGADLRVCPNTNTPHGSNSANGSGTPHGSEEGEHIEHIGSPLHRVVQWFKTMSTNEYIRGVKNMGWQPFNGKLWQRNYWEHIIRNEQSHQTISKYIIDNPAKWNDDKFNKPL